jgi:hypothetical protein
MAMNKREKLLAAGVGVVATLFLGRSVYMSIQDGFDKKSQTVETLKKKKDEQELQMTAGKVASLKLNKVVAKSLPRTDEIATADYQKWLISLGDEAKLVSPNVNFLTDNTEKDGSYRTYKFKIQGTGTIENATQLLYGFYAKDYLHRIYRFDMNPLRSATEPDQLSITLDCEVLALGIAKDKQDPPKGISNRVAKSLDEYKETILARNLFAPANQPPRLEPKKSVDAKVGIQLEHSVNAKETDPNQRVVYQLLGEIPKGLLIDQNTGNLTFRSNETGEYQVEIQATDNGIPRKSTTQSLTIKVNPLPPPAPVPIQFDVASQALVTGLLAGSKGPGSKGPEVWILSKTESKTYKLFKGDQLKLGGVIGLVTEVGANYVELETEGRRWLIGLDETVADAYSRSKKD